MNASSFLNSLVPLLVLCISGATSCSHNTKSNHLSDNTDSVAFEASTLTHPQAENEFSTRVYVSTAIRHTPGEVAECIEQITAVSYESANQDDMIKAVAQTRTLFSANISLYHSCFYHLAARLDNRLAQGGPLISELAREFFETTQALWIMAKALDQISGKNIYNSYLKQRYIQISRDVFGRNVAPLGDGFSDKEQPGGNIKQSSEKPAGKFKE